MARGLQAARGTGDGRAVAEHVAEWAPGKEPVTVVLAGFVIGLVFSGADPNAAIPRVSPTGG